MLNLVKKDLILLKKINIFTLIYVLFIAGMGLTMPQYIVANILYILGMIILIFVSTIYVNGYDDKYKSEIILNSFPIDRRNIVRGKYIILIIYIIISCGFIVLFTNIIPAIGLIDNGVKVSIWSVVFVVNISLIFYSIYYPFYFWFGEGLRSFNYILWILIIVAPTIINKLMQNLDKTVYLEKILKIDFNKMNIYLFIFVLVIYYISLKISESIYLKKEF